MKAALTFLVYICNFPSTFLQLLSPYMELISPSSLATLESLKIHPVSRPVEENAKIEVSNVKHYFLDISPKVILDISTPNAAYTSFQCKVFTPL